MVQCQGEEIGGVAEAPRTYGMDKQEDNFLHGDSPVGRLEMKTLNSSESVGYKIRISVRHRSSLNQPHYRGLCDVELLLKIQAQGKAV